MFKNLPHNLCKSQFIISSVQTKDDGVVLSAKVTGVQKKWDNICQRLHHTQLPSEEKTFPTVLGFRFVEDKKENADNHSCNNTDASSNETDCVNVDSCMPMQKITTLQSSNSFPLVSKPKNESLLSKQWGKPLNAEDLESGGLNSPHCSVSNSSMGDSSRTSPTSATSVTTDLGLGICSSPISNKPKKCTHQNSTDLPQGFSGRFSTDVDVVNGNISSHLTRSSSFSSPDYGGQFYRIDPKTLFRALSERVSWQDEAICVISQTIACCQPRSKKRHGASLRADIWFNFVGPDRLGKKKIALALAEKLHESQEHFISMDLSSQDGMINSNTVFGLRGMNCYDIKFRGKTLVDCLAEELTKKPLSIAFLENVDKADVLTQNSLSQAIRTGKLSDSHGREISINNTIFVTTSTFSTGNYPHTVRREPSKYSAERILAVKWWPMQIRIGHAFGDNAKSQSMNVSDTMRKDISNPIFLNKRKLVSGTDSLGQPKISEMAKRAHKTSTRYLDLNLPAEENEVHDSNDGNSDKDSISENSKAWLQDFSDHVDKTVVFKPFDFDALADKLLKEVTKSFHKIVGSNCFLEIDSKVMDQLLAASYIPDRNTVVEDWVERVLSRAFAEVPNRYNLTAHSVVKLATCEGLCVEELAPEVYLPSRIILN